MYTVAIPVTNRYSNRRMDCEAVLSELRRAGATRVWLCTARGIERVKDLTGKGPDHDRCGGHGHA